MFDCFAVSIVHSFLFVGHQGSSQSDLRTNTGFGSFKLPTCGWLQNGVWSPAQYGSWDMLHVGLEHVGSLHAILHILFSPPAYGI